MKMSHRHMQYLLVSCISILAAILGLQAIMMFALEQPGRLIQIVGMSILIISGIWRFRISRRAEEAELLESSKAGEPEEPGG